ncbi:uncharacterized protein [Panulirus ornatus]|uniref:uncharacterized protein n=1 Tax=Panulirus ornatus TaxID=150431 RepID=UPI003A88B594
MVTVPTVGGEWHKFFAASESEVYRKFADLVFIGPTTSEGLVMATKHNTALMTDRRNMAIEIAKHFTRADGSTQFYLGRESILPVPAGLPVTHDAPFRPQLDRCLMAIVESGLLKKWGDDTLIETRRDGQRRHRQKQAKEQAAAAGAAAATTRDGKKARQQHHGPHPHTHAGTTLTPPPEPCSRWHHFPRRDPPNEIQEVQYDHISIQR